MFVYRPDPLASSLGDQLRDLRRLHRLSRRVVSERSGLDPVTIAKLESNEGTIASLMRLAQVLDASLEGVVEENVGAWLRDLRQRNGLSLAAAAAAAELTKPTIINLERGSGRVESFLKVLRAYRHPPRLWPRAATSLGATVFHGDATEVCRGFDSGSFSACITDAPYHLGGVRPSTIQKMISRWNDGIERSGPASVSYMSPQWSDADWDNGLPEPHFWREVFRLLRPGGHVMCFCAPRNAYLTMTALALAGYEIKDPIIWVFRTGFRGGTDVGRTIGKRALKERGVLADALVARRRFPSRGHRGLPRAGYAIETDEIAELVPEVADLIRENARVRDGIRPAYEMIVVARKPVEKTLADNVVQYGVGGANVRSARWRSEDGRLRDPMTVVGEMDPSEQAYFYSPKATAEERQLFVPPSMSNDHPTLKPMALMRWLIKLYGGVRGPILDPFCGSGTTGIACVLEGRTFIGIEREATYADLAKARLQRAEPSVREASLERRLDPGSNRDGELPGGSPSCP